MTDNKKSNLIGWGIIILYAALYIVTTIFHEPWFDEAQAWEIAKCGSYRDLLFLIPHGEGHPPLWSLILSIPAKTGVPYELGLKAVAFIFSIATAYLIIFKSPFPKWIRCTLPFTYFFFYQYGIISRTYCVVMFLICLLAVSFKNKDEHPYRYVGLLALLCSSSAYGIVIAGGISICWLVDIWLDNKDVVARNGIKVLFDDKRIKALIALLMVAILLILEILPYESTVAANSSRYEYLGKKFAYMFFTMQGDAFMSSTFPEIWERAGLLAFVPGIVATVIAWAYFCFVSPKKKWKYYFIPETLFATLMTYYGFQHHSGICVLIYIAAAWSGYDAEYKNSQTEKLKTLFGGGNGGALVWFIKVIPAITMGIMLFYSALSVQKDIAHPYSEGKEIANFIKEHHMEDARIMTEWYTSYAKTEKDNIKDGEEYELTIEDFDSNFVATAVPIIPYFDKNIVFNHNDRFDHAGYVTHFVASAEENMDNYSRWKEYGYPEVLIGSPRIDFVYGNEIDYSDYELVLNAKNCPIWKGSMSEFTTRVYVRKDCLEKYGFN